MKDIIKNNLKDENYLQVLFDRLTIQRNEALDKVSFLETELLKMNSILQDLSEENKQLKEKTESKNTDS
jgi:organic radical activating enzyme